jgi:hypothetical protein
MNRGNLRNIETLLCRTRADYSLGPLHGSHPALPAMRPSGSIRGAVLTRRNLSRRIVAAVTRRKLRVFAGKSVFQTAPAQNSARLPPLAACDYFRALHPRAKCRPTGCSCCRRRKATPVVKSVG